MSDVPLRHHLPLGTLGWPGHAVPALAAVPGEVTSASSAREQGNVPQSFEAIFPGLGHAGTLMQGESTTCSLLHGNLWAETKALPVLVEICEVPKSGQNTAALDPGPA